MAAVLLAACEEVTTAEPEATWTGSIGRLVAYGGKPENLEFVRQDGAGAEHGQMTAVAGTDQNEAVRLETLTQPPDMESLQARLATSGDIDAGSQCWLHFDARAVQPQVELGLGRLSILVRSRTADAEAILDRSIYLEPDWKPIDVTFRAPVDVDAGDADVIFGVGTQLQVIDLAGVVMRCFEGDDAPPDLPSTAFSYAGREPDAAWRAIADNQIERYRKGDLTIDVVDADGQPVADAEIHVQMARHAFAFGTAVDAGLLAGRGPDVNQGITTAYRKNLKELFNTATIEQGLNWRAWADEGARDVTDEALAWIQSLGLDLRGRGLVPTEGVDLTPELQDKRDDPEAVREAVRAGITKTVGDLDERVTAWEVVDRPREHRDLLDLLGDDELATWFQLVQTTAPNVGLVLNESDILAGDRMAELASLLGNLLAGGVPIDQVGVQGHFGAQPPPIQVLSDRLDQLASFNLPLVVSAFDMVTADQQLQQDFSRDFMTLAFSHPSVEGFLFEHFWADGDETGAALYREDGSITPIGQAYRDLVLGNWWTDIVALSNTAGTLTSRVFQGDYMVTARKDDLSATATLAIGPDGARVTLQLVAADDGERAL